MADDELLSESFIQKMERANNKMEKPRKKMLACDAGFIFTNFSVFAPVPLDICSFGRLFHASSRLQTHLSKGDALYVVLFYTVPIGHKRCPNMCV